MTAEEPVQQDLIPQPSEREVELEAENQRLQGAVEALKDRPAPTPEPVKSFTRAELQARVEQGQLGEGEVEAILDKQSDDRTRQLVQQEGERVRREVEVDNKMRSFQAARPELLDPASDLRKQVLEKYQMFRGYGDPDDSVTELKAYEAVMGSTVPQSRDQTRGRRATSPEGGGGNHPPRSQPSGEADFDSEGFPNDLSKDMKYHYKQMIARGAYTGPKDPTLVRELEYRKGGPKGGREHRSRRQNTVIASRVQR